MVSSLKAVRIAALSLLTTARSSACVFVARTMRIKSRSLHDILKENWARGEGTGAGACLLPEAEEEKVCELET
jgi:hypothetical protein